MQRDKYLPYCPYCKKPNSATDQVFYKAFHLETVLQKCEYCGKDYDVTIIKSPMMFRQEEK